MTEDNSKVMASAMQSKTEKFIQKAIKVHGLNRYDYSMVDYLNNSTKVKIRCVLHNHIFKQRPNCHLSGKGCSKCGGSERLTTELFIERARLIHIGFDYDYSGVLYINSHTRVGINCPKHGVFTVRPNSVLAKGAKCQRCTKEINAIKNTVPFEVFKSKSIRIHGIKYSYDESFYSGITKKTKIFCDIHGWFWQLPVDHIDGHGCKKCSMTLHGFGRENFINICEKNKRLASLYVVKCIGDSEVFYKVGITSQSIAERFHGRAMPYNYEILHLVTGGAGFIYDLETQIHRLLREHKYRPKIKFKGDKFECFSTITKPVQKLLFQMQESKQIQLVA